MKKKIPKPQASPNISPCSCGLHFGKTWHLEDNKMICNSCGGEIFAKQEPKPQAEPDVCGCGTEKELEMQVGTHAYYDVVNENGGRAWKCDKCGKKLKPILGKFGVCETAEADKLPTYSRNEGLYPAEPPKSISGGEKEVDVTLRMIGKMAQKEKEHKEIEGLKCIVGDCEEHQDKINEIIKAVNEMRYK